MSRVGARKAQPPRVGHYEVGPSGTPWGIGLLLHADLKFSVRGFLCRPVVIPENCLNCGVCCFSKSGTYVRVSEKDLLRMGELAHDWVRTVGTEHYMRMEDGHCLALQITTHRGQAPMYFCAIYGVRPQVCRDLTQGKAACQVELRSKEDKVRRLYG